MKNYIAPQTVEVKATLRATILAGSSKAAAGQQENVNVSGTTIDAGDSRANRRITEF